MANFVSEEQRSRLPAIGAVVLVHVGIGYALLSGLAMTVIKQIPGVTIVENYAEPVPPPPDVAPPQSKPQATRQHLDAPVPKLDLPVPKTFELGQIPTIPLSGPDSLPAANDKGAAALPEPPAMPSQASAAKARGDRGQWITSDDYPPAARRAEESGTVGIQAAIDPSGRVFACTVVASSGSTALDAATCKLYQNRGRFTPARDADGKAIASTLTDRIRWQLPD